MNYAYMETEDANGNNNDYYNFEWDNRIDTQKGLLFLGREHLNQVGTLYAIRNDGSKLIYDLGTGAKTATVGVNTSIGGHIKGDRTVVDNTDKIVFQAGDELIQATYTIELKAVTVQFPDGLNRYPTKVAVIDAATFAADPNSDWIEFNPITDPVTFSVGAQRIIIRFDYDEPPQKLPEYNSGNSSGSKG